MQDKQRPTRTHFDGPTGKWLAWLDPWKPNEPVGTGDNEPAAKADLERQQKDAPK